MACSGLPAGYSAMISYLLTAFVAATPITSVSGQAAVAIKARTKTDIEAATRLQVFLDRAEFAPGKIAGHYVAFTLKAFALYREANSGSPVRTAAPAPAKPTKKTKHAQ